MTTKKKAVSKAPTKKDIANWKRRIRKAYGKKTDPTVTIKKFEERKYFDPNLLSFFCDELFPKKLKPFKQCLDTETLRNHFDGYFDFEDFPTIDLYRWEDLVAGIVDYMERLRGKNENLMLACWDYNEDPEMVILQPLSDEELGELELKYQEEQEKRKAKQEGAEQWKLRTKQLVEVRALFNKLLSQVGAEEVERALRSVKV